ncbi:hypothetical protein LuPra_03903 [Luteitalea pratensis]|uniref:Uncharacterized protein n=1 Tax=Luteitalea pratensis TaxID=1855912 RepID=A0A143PS74_LUTPR|nr:hypothetical protein LuPra_03903 [Luteitalea pratensis]
MVHLCAHYFVGAAPSRISIAVADCGIGIPNHLAAAYPELRGNDARAVYESLKPGVTGAIRGMYGTPNNAGAGLYVTRSIAKGTGGYFAVVSGRAAYRTFRSDDGGEQGTLFPEPERDKHRMFADFKGWDGTVVALEIRPEILDDFETILGWVCGSMPAALQMRRAQSRGRLNTPESSPRATAGRSTRRTSTSMTA